MDPKETFIELAIAIRDRDGETLRERASDLADWIEKGGFTLDVAEMARALDSL